MGENCIVMTHPDMNLTAGTTLQNQKYVIHRLLHQSDFGVTYQARHAYLEQFVALQTLNDSLRQRHDYIHIQQQFLTKVRSLAQQSIAHARVLDCFEEEGIPFVVFELVPGRMPPQLTDWLTIAPAETSAPMVAAKMAERTDDSQFPAAPDLSALNSADATLPPAPAVSTPAVSTPAPPQVPPQVSPRPLSHPPLSTAMATQFVKAPPAAGARTKGWLPLSLLVMSMVGGLLGAGFGLSVRLGSTTQTQVTPAKLTPRLFSREQSFPSGAEWPVSETPQIYTSDPTPIEEPVYRVSPAVEDDSLPTFQPLPDTRIQDPILPPDPPSALKTGTSTQPSPQPDLPPSLPPITGAPDTTASPPSQAFEVPPPPAPAEPELPSLAPPADLPASISPSLPLPDAAPKAPILPANEPPVIQQ